jgi:hypothetical protein
MPTVSPTKENQDFMSSEFALLEIILKKKKIIVPFTDKTLKPK